SKEKLLLNRKREDLCSQCHKDFLAGAKFKHAPAESGDCWACHAAHSSTERFLLAKTGQPLCLECHERIDIAKAPGHRQMGDQSCTTCHDPHRGETRFLLKAGVRADTSTSFPAK
ncbi:MAG TPA: cytochrome c3 family protein, partial [Candidatus Paceibacterota bacterium]|nr:cytochrome c3 family protein [Candidatus Paceibacterota bacterium]